MIQQKAGQTSSAKHRYKIKSLLSEMEPDVKNAICKRIKAGCNISRASLSRYLNERKNTPAHMPANVLQAFASELGKTMEDLVNK